MGQIDYADLLPRATPLLNRTQMRRRCMDKGFLSVSRWYSGSRLMSPQVAARLEHQFRSQSVAEHKPMDFCIHSTLSAKRRVLYMEEDIVSSGEVALQLFHIPKKKTCFRACCGVARDRGSGWQRMPTRLFPIFPDYPRMSRKKYTLHDIPAVNVLHPCEATRPASILSLVDWRTTQ